MIGFSTGALAKGNLVKAFEMSRELGCKAIEVSAIRENELFLAIELLPQFIKHFSHVSFHAPSKLEFFSEPELVGLLKRVNVPIIVHPDIISDFALWDTLPIVVENMDHRKKIGQTSKDLDEIFRKFPSTNVIEANLFVPKARFCLDLAHALYLDKSGLLIKDLLHHYQEIMKEIHISEIDEKGQHRGISINSYRKFMTLKLKKNIPFIIESVTNDPKEEYEIVKEIYDTTTKG